MARRVQRQLIDDFDGSEATQTVWFAYAGRSYEIDLNAEHAFGLDQALAPYLAHARRVNGVRPTRGRRTGAPRQSRMPQTSPSAQSEPDRPGSDPDEVASVVCAEDATYAAAPGGPEQVSALGRDDADSEVVGRPSSQPEEAPTSADVGSPFSWSTGP
jgi:Lsr2 protein